VTKRYGERTVVCELYLAGEPGIRLLVSGLVPPIPRLSTGAGRSPYTERVGKDPARLGNPYAQWSRSTSSFVSACSREKAKQPSRKRKRSSSSS
jgi:hypothetical protein